MSELIEDLNILNKTTNRACQMQLGKHALQIDRRKLYIESYGCQMNFSDSEIVAAIMQEQGFSTTSQLEEADLVFLNTCSIREKAEETIRKRLKHFNGLKKRKPELTIGILGCMAERLKTRLLEEEKIVDIVAGPDAYRHLPQLVQKADAGSKGINVLLSREETYADINPIRLNANKVTAFISIMRGCDNMCSFCVVPFTRGRERSRPPYSIVREARELFERGYREITLLGQNVDSYKWLTESCLKGKARIEKSGKSNIINFAQLLEMTAQIHADLRIRFSTSHPKDITNEVLYTMKKYENICKHIHLPAQSGNTEILQRMNRTYTREWYIERVNTIRSILGSECGISSDMIAGFCGETEKQHQDTLSLMDYVQYDFSYMFYYSQRPRTSAARKFKDDISLTVKKKRLQEIIIKQNEISLACNKQNIGKIFKVLIEGFSKRSENDLQGRNSANKVIIFPRGKHQKGEYVFVKVYECSSATLLGEVVEM